MADRIPRRPWPRLVAAVALAAELAACSAVPAQPPDPQVVADIVAACTVTGLFKPVVSAANGAIVAAVPAVALPVAVITAGVDKVCADPAKFASDLSTVAWVAKNLKTIAALEKKPDGP